MKAFFHRAEGLPVDMDFNTLYGEHLRRIGSRRRRREFFLSILDSARRIQGGHSREGLFLGSHKHNLPYLEVLEFTGSDAKVLTTPYLLEAVLDGHITLLAPRLLKASLTGPFPPQSLLLRSLGLRWTVSRCAELPTLLATLSCLKEFSLHLEDTRLPGSVDTQREGQTRAALLPALSELRVIGYGAAHHSICELLDQLAASSAHSLRRFEVGCTHAALAQSNHALNALRTAAHAIQADSAYIHFRDVPSGVIAVISLSSQKFRHDQQRCPFVTFKATIAEGFDLSVDELVRTRLVTLLPLDHVTHLYLDCVPMPEPSPYAQPAFISAMKQLTSVRILHANDNDRYPGLLHSMPESHPLVGALEAPRCLPALEVLDVSYSTGMFRDWWTRLAIALAIRSRTGMPLTSLRITHTWGPNVRRPESAARSPLETFHKNPNVNPHDPDAFILNSPPDAFSVDGGSVWAKEKVESVARSLFGQVVQKIEVEEASRIQSFWPPVL
ncbi:unnamed protein product [Peniophora sp. CBMAI 1063]|nr:unnamed protein product [Peniophora sp. CBMAI 1063]